MKSKNIYILVLLLLASCSKQLETTDYMNLTSENFFKTESDFNAAVIALYSPFSTDWGATDPGDGVWYSSLYNTNVKTYLTRSELTTDEMVDVNTWESNLKYFTWNAGTWQGSYEPTYAKIRFIARATDVIDKISNSTASESIKQRYIGEALILRAWLMYILYDFFGPVNPKLDAEALSDTSITPRLSSDEYCSAVESDLNEALQVSELPDKYNEDDDNWGRVSKSTAQMLLLKLYMHNKQWDKAEAAARQLMQMGYVLQKNYVDVFTERQNEEIIYAVPNATATNWYMPHLFPEDFAKGYAGNLLISRDGGWYGFAMPWAFYDKFPANDKRLNTIISSYVNSQGDTVDRNSWWFGGAIPLKYTNLEDNLVGNGYTIDWVVFRYAEVLLSLAEALNEQSGPSDEAYSLVDSIRFRAGLNGWSRTLTQQEFRDSILDERGRELYSEGVRRQDLIRHGKFISYAIARGADAKSYQVLFPIPVDVILEGNGIIKQNSGYSD
jgi:starch-binding outer membrane protein, SusD/RagB family